MGHLPLKISTVPISTNEHSIPTKKFATYTRIVIWKNKKKINFTLSKAKKTNIWSYSRSCSVSVNDATVSYDSNGTTCMFLFIYIRKSQSTFTFFYTYFPTCIPCLFSISSNILPSLLGQNVNDTKINFLHSYMLVRCKISRDK